MSARNRPFTALVLTTLWTLPVWAGDLNAPAAPTDPGSAMYGLDDVFNRLDTGEAGAKRTGAFTEPASGPGSTGRTLDEVMGKAPAVDDTSGATTADVLQGKTFWGLRSDGTWGNSTGALATQTIDNTTTSQSAGNYAAFDLATEDADLASGNIADGVIIYGVTGAAKVATGDAVSGDVLSGKTFSNTGAVNISGTMANVGVQNINPGTTAQTITQGYHDGTGEVAGDPDLVTTNIRSGTTIFGVAGDSNVVNTSSGDAVAGDVRSGKKAWVDGSEVTGILEDRTLSAANDTVAAGIYAATTLSTVDTDLAAANIRSGTNIFGVAGDSNVVNTSSGDAVAGDVRIGKKAWVDGSEVTGILAPAAVERTGQTPTVPFAALTGSDGDLERGVVWPNQRFTNNSDGTVTDNLTGLIWLQNANCAAAARSWTQALTDVGQLNTDGTMNSNNCGDISSDGSNQDDWRLPNRRELESLLAIAYISPALSNTVGTGQWTAGDPFSGIQPTSSYWSSSISAGNVEDAWIVHFTNGLIETSSKTDPHLVWPVRAGQ